MPIPQPNTGESREDFIARCMGSEALQAEFPDQDQRAAVCYRTWREKAAPMSSVVRKIAVEDSAPRDINDTEHSIKSVVSTEGVDSDGDVVVQKGLDWSRFRKNPVVLFQHDPFMPIGKSLWQTVDGGRVVAKTMFAASGLGEEIFDLYKQGILKGWSIGMAYDTVKRRRVTPEDVRKNAKLEGAQCVIESAQILEYSAASIPANEDALSLAFKGGAYKKVAGYLDYNRHRIERPVTVKVIGMRQPMTAAAVNEMIDKALRRSRGIL
jgi:hypothetical protein